jgi:magnesium-transporting ATPase (P-type)
MEIFLQVLKDSGVGPTVIGLVLFLIWMVNKLPAFNEYHKNRKKEKIESLDKAIGSNISESEKALLNQEKSQQIFFEATGFNGHEKLREKLAAFLLNSHGKYRLQDFINIRPYLEFDKHKNQISISIKQFIWYGQAFMWLIFIGLIVTILFTIVSFIIFYSFFIKIFSNDPVFSISLVVVPLFLLALYAPDARNFRTLNQLYETDQYLFKYRRPDKRWMYPTVVIYIAVFYVFILWVRTIT